MSEILPIIVITAVVLVISGGLFVSSLDSTPRKRWSRTHKEAFGGLEHLQKVLATQGSGRIVNVLCKVSSSQWHVASALVEEMDLTMERERALVGAALMNLEPDDDDSFGFRWWLLQGLLKNPGASEKVSLAALAYLRDNPDSEAAWQGVYASVDHGWTPNRQDQADVLRLLPETLEAGLSSRIDFTWPQNVPLSAYQETETGRIYLESIRSTVDTDVWDALAPTWHRDLDELVEACSLV